jgi:hypothetical protein
MPNIRVPPEVFRVLMLKKMCLVRLALTEQLKVLGNRDPGQSISNIGPRLRDC